MKSVFPDGTEVHRQDGLYHRVGGPAIVSATGLQSWWYKGVPGDIVFSEVKDETSDFDGKKKRFMSAAYTVLHDKDANRETLIDAYETLRFVWRESSKDVHFTALIHRWWLLCRSIERITPNEVLQRWAGGEIVYIEEHLCHRFSDLERAAFWKLAFTHVIETYDSRLETYMKFPSARELMLEQGYVDPDDSTILDVAL